MCGSLLETDQRFMAGPHYTESTGKIAIGIPFHKHPNSLEMSTQNQSFLIARATSHNHIIPSDYQSTLDY